MSESGTMSKGNFVNVFSGLGMGLLVGIIVGLSVSPVVSIILGALASLLAAFLGLQGEASAARPADESFLSRFKMNGLRIGSFGFACVAGILLGLFIRSQDVFSDSIREQVDEWKNAGYKEQDALQFAAFKKLGIQPEGKQVVVGEMQKAQMTALFGALTEMDMCNQLTRVSGVQEVLGVYRRFYVGDETDKKNTLYKKLGALADEIERLPAEHQTEILDAVKEVLCELQRLEK